MIRRVFAGIEISEPAREAATKYVSELREEFLDAPARWERPDKLHITVKFAGSLDETELGEFTHQVKTAASAMASFQIKIAGSGAFVKRCGPSVLWLGVEQITEEDPLGKIASILGYDGRQFHPHITIVRIKDAKKANTLI